MFKKVLQIIIKKGVIFFPIFYITISLVEILEFKFRICLFLLILGGILNYIYSTYMEEETLRIVPKHKFNDNQKCSWIFWKGMKPWEIIHWIIVLVFFTLTSWAMWEGLSLLFMSNTENIIFVTIFTICVTCTLLWLVVMITRGKHFVGYIMFYLIFDLLSAFSFNYIHFYDNVSVTQRVDATMKACQMFSDLEGNTISEIKRVAERDSAKYAGADSTKAKKKSEIQGNAKEKIAAIYKDYIDGKISEKKYNANYNKYKNEEENKIKKLDNTNEKKDEDYTLSDLSHKTDSMKLILNNLCDEYTTNKSTFTLGQVNQAKNAVRALNSNIQTYQSDKNINVSASHKDSVNYILETIHQKGENRFESFVDLFNLLDFSRENANNKTLDSTNVSRGVVYDTLIKQEKNLEKGIMYQSIALSALIDAVPLVLGIFVAWAKRKDEE